MRKNVSKSRRSLPMAASIAIISVALVGCAGVPSTTGVDTRPAPAPAAANAPIAAKADASAEALLQRAQAYWDLVKANNNIAAWTYEAQSKDPRWSLEGYLKKGGIVYDSVKVTDVKSIEGDSAQVGLKMVYTLPLIRVKNKELTTVDQWKLIDGVWYHSPPRSGLMPAAK